MDVAFDDAVLASLAASEIEKILDVIENLMIIFCVSCETFILQIQVESFLPTNETNFVLVLLYVLLLLSQL